MCPQEGVSGGGAYKSRIQSPYQIWLARKVERAVERALQHEGQQILEEYVVSRKWVLPQICEERRHVTTKIHSLLLQWRPDFSAEWSLKLRRALPILEIFFSHMASSKEDFSNPLLIEPRLKGVLSFLHNESAAWPIQSSTHHRFATYLYCFHNPCHHLCSEERIEDAEKACGCKICPHVDEERSHRIGQEACPCRSCLDADKDRQNVKGHEARVSPNLDEKRSSEKAHNAISCLCESWEQRLDTKVQNAPVFGSCLRVADELDEGILDDSLEWSTVNLPSRGTVASLMASELRSSRKEEANQALWNALASKEVALLEDNLHKHGEFASKWIVSKIMTMVKRSKKKKSHQRVKKVCAEQLLHAAAEEKNCRAESPTLKMRRSLSKGLFGLFSCHTAASEEHGLSADQKPLPTDLAALESNQPCCLVDMHSKHVGDHAEKDDVIQAEMPISCSSSMIYTNASSVVSSSDVDNDDDNDNDNDNGSCHIILHTKSLHCKPINETPASLVTYSTRINGSEEFTCSRLKDSHDRHSRMLSGNVSACHHNVEVSITARALSSGYGCVDAQIDLVQSSPYDGNGVISSNQVARSDQDSGNIKSADEGFGHTRNYDPKGASMASCSHHGDSELRGRPSVISHDDDDDGIRSLACSSITNELLRGQEGACFIVKGRREDPPNCSLSLEEAYGGPCKTSMDIIVDRSCNMMKPRRTKSILSHMNSDDQQKDMQTSLLHKDGERQGKGTASSSNVLQGSKDENQVVEVSAKFGATQSSDEERQGEEGSDSGSQRVRVPLSSLLAEREDWSVHTGTSLRAWGGACSWDTWEEPNEALDPLCCVCMMGLKGAAFTPCGHTFCRKCSRELWQGRGTCPLCNKLITGILDIF